MKIFLGAFLSLLCAWAEATAPCTHHATYFPVTQRCFIFHSSRLTFEAAETACVKLDGHLARVDNGFENMFIADHVSTSQEGYWLGGNDLSNSGQWQWTDGSLLMYTNWAPGEPVHSPAKPCLEASKGRGVWQSTDCFKKLPYVCEVPNAATSPAAKKI